MYPGLNTRKEFWNTVYHLQLADFVPLYKSITWKVEPFNSYLCITDLKLGDVILE
jgi:hypothetical protein